MSDIETRLAAVERSVRRWRAGACAAGVVLAAVLLAGAQRQQPEVPRPAAAPVLPRFQIAGSGDSFMVLDNQTATVSLLFKKRVNGKAPPDWPWACDQSFSIQDALARPEGAEVQPGAGR